MEEELNKHSKLNSQLELNLANAKQKLVATEKAMLKERHKVSDSSAHNAIIGCNLDWANSSNKNLFCYTYVGIFKFKLYIFQLFN